MVHHTDPWFQAFYAEQTARLQQLLAIRTPPVLVQGEAVVALEAAAASLVAPGDRVLNVVSGHYSRFFTLWLKRWTDAVEEVAVPDDQVPSAEALDLALTHAPGTAIVAIVHCETPSGTLLPLADLANVANRHGALVLVDAVASVGGMALDLDGWGIDLAVLGLHKCLGGPPGLTPVHLSNRAWAKIHANPAAPTASILSLKDWHGAHDPAVPFPFTPSILEIYALEGVLTAWAAEGVANVIARHAAVARATRAGVAMLGLDLFPADPATAADCVTAIRLPDGIDERDLRARVRDQFGIWLAGGEGTLKGRVLRIGHMGEAARMTTPELAIPALRTVLANRLKA
jgi:pyridoxamine--pyruvate transaminase